MQEIRLTVRVKPGSSRARVGGSYGEQGALVVAVNAPPVDGRANDAVCAAVAEALELRPRDVHVVSGHTARTKILGITCSPASIDAVTARIEGLRTQS